MEGSAAIDPFSSISPWVGVNEFYFSALPLGFAITKLLLYKLLLHQSTACFA
jgi:hypothetical protein